MNTYKQPDIDSAVLLLICKTPMPAGCGWFVPLRESSNKKEAALVSLFFFFFLLGLTPTPKKNQKKTESPIVAVKLDRFGDCDDAGSIISTSSLAKDPALSASRTP